jgi:hypothetical protein
MDCEQLLFEERRRRNPGCGRLAVASLPGRQRFGVRVNDKRIASSARRRTRLPPASGRPTRFASRSNVAKRPPGEDERRLSVAQGKAGKAPLPLHDVTKVLKDAAEALVEDAKLDRFAAVESNTLCIFPEAHQAEPEVGLEALPGNIQRH